MPSRHTTGQTKNTEEYDMNKRQKEFRKKISLVLIALLLAVFAFTSTTASAKGLYASTPTPKPVEKTEQSVTIPAESSVEVLVNTDSEYPEKYTFKFSGGKIVDANHYTCPLGKKDGCGWDREDYYSPGMCFFTEYWSLELCSFLQAKPRIKMYKMTDNANAYLIAPKTAVVTVTKIKK
jgi:hypothetical protein